MTMEPTSIEKQVKAFCAQVGADPLLVQGAGGNVSWKDDNTLWVKASGTWLAEAESKEIFVPVNLSHLQDALAKQDFSVKPEVNGNSDLRPSIETLLHALMPHRVVVHLHAVEILAHLVQVNSIQNIKNIVGNSVKWIYVDYYKPGADLARAVYEQLRDHNDVVFLANHGVVIGGKDVEEVRANLSLLVRKLTVEASNLSQSAHAPTDDIKFLARDYVPCFDNKVALLALEQKLIRMLRGGWALYPDHVVFLGSRPVILESGFNSEDLEQALNSNPPFIFVLGKGVYESINVTLAQKAQLRCYFDVVSRQEDLELICPLSNLQIAELLDWEAEKYRQTLDSNQLDSRDL